MASGARFASASETISADLWRQLKPRTLVLAAGFDEQDNLAGWWEAIIVRVDDGEFLVRWRDDPSEPSEPQPGICCPPSPDTHQLLIRANINTRLAGYSPDWIPA
jgi:hypothetical protein